MKLDGRQPTIHAVPVANYLLPPKHPMSNTISYEPSENVLCQQVGHEAVLLDLDSSRYFGLTPVAARIWELLSAGQSVSSAADIVAAEYREPTSKVLDDVLAFVQLAASRGLLTQRS